MERLNLKTGNSKVCFFTIVSRNYMHYARTLMNSIVSNFPEAKCVVGLCDKVGDFKFVSVVSMC